MNMLNMNLSCQRQGFTLSIKQAFPLDGIVGILGHSGSGKTTLLRAIAGLEKKVVGSLIINQQQLMNTTAKHFIASEKRNISLVFQDARLFPHLNVEQNLAFAVKRCAQPTLNMFDIVALTNIEHLLKSNVKEISAGEKQRVALARAILSEPKLLLLDEPLSALDQKSKVALIALLKKVHQQLQLPMLYVSHNIDEIQQLADQLLVLNNGEVAHYGPVHHIIHQLNNTGLIKQQTSLSLPITNIDKQHGLVSLAIGEQHIQLPLAHINHSHEQHSSIPPNQQLRCFIFANDISIAIREPITSSIVNQLRAEIIAITKVKYQVLVELRCSEHLFFASISSFSLAKLQLQKQQVVYLQFKASAVRTLKGASLVNN